VVEAVLCTLTDCDEAAHQMRLGGAAALLFSMISSSTVLARKARKLGNHQLDASCTPADITIPYRFELASQRRDGTEKYYRLIFAISQGLDASPHYHAKSSFSSSRGKQKKPRCANPRLQ